MFDRANVNAHILLSDIPVSYFKPKRGAAIPVYAAANRRLFKKISRETVRRAAGRWC